jgi:hypothetical protein
MTIGRTVSKAELDSATGQIALSLYRTMENIDQVQAWLAGFSSAQLVSAGYCTDTTDGDRLKSAFTDMSNLSTIWAGGAATGTMPRDHRLFAKWLLGVGVF